MTRGALVGLAAFAVMAWLNRRPPSWWEGRPRPERRPPAGPVRGEIIRPGSGRDLERRP